MWEKVYSTGPEAWSFSNYFAAEFSRFLIVVKLSEFTQRNPKSFLSLSWILCELGYSMKFAKCIKIALTVCFSHCKYIVSCKYTKILFSVKLTFVNKEHPATTNKFIFEMYQKYSIMGMRSLSAVWQVITSHFVAGNNF